MTALLLICRLAGMPVAAVKTGAGVIKRTAAVRRYRRARRIVKAAGIGTVKTTAARKLVWLCWSVPLAAGVGGGMWAGLPPYAGGAAVPARDAPVAGAHGTGFYGAHGTTEAGDAAIIYLPPEWLEQSEAIGTLPPAAFAPVPDFPLPVPTVPQPPEIGPATPDQPQPIPESGSLTILATALVCAAIILGGRYA